ncbi:MAG: ribbon-helix-helix domain-containing protein [Deltaproteobacteria bacterium]|nr:ribbon-helix-helix domain-containing protein [Deltaproteobacteria bacterium]
MPRKKIPTTVYLTPEQADALRSLHERTKVPVAEYVREGIDLILERHADVLPGQVTIPGLEEPGRRRARAGAESDR